MYKKINLNSYHIGGLRPLFALLFLEVSKLICENKAVFGYIWLKLHKTFSFSRTLFYGQLVHPNHLVTNSWSRQIFIEHSPYQNGQAFLDIV